MLVSPDRVPRLFRHLTAAPSPDRIASHELSQLRHRPDGSIMVIGGGILIAMLVLESPR
jgi:hypothetical protein